VAALSAQAARARTNATTASAKAGAEAFSLEIRRPPRGRFDKPAGFESNMSSPPTANDHNTGFPIVGIGASAGGLGAFKQFFTALPDDTGLAFVLIQHLDPAHESLTADLLARCTPMPVEQVEDRMRVEPNRVYVIPPNTSLTLEQGVLHLGKPVVYRGMRMPIDHFFRSLAQDQQARAIGIILSGTGTDGTLGVKAIKEGGGLVMVESPETAQYDGMARSALTTGVVDQVLPVERLPEALLGYIEHAYVKGLTVPEQLADRAPEQLPRVLAILRTRSGFDFGCYKDGTLLRRIARRMSLHHLDDLNDYAQFLRDRPEEITGLFKDLLIGVTHFFREPEAFERLAQEVISPLVAERSPNSPVRVWVPGCATGEEAYAIAMLLTERLEAVHKTGLYQVFASDVDKEALSVARTGRYPENIAADVAPERLQRFFIREGASYVVNKALRESILFAPQNVLSDPPFSRLDLISCRNLLIYLKPEAQRRVLGLFHFALNPEGYLFLGSAEGIGQQTNLFQGVSKKARIFRRIGGVGHQALELPNFAGTPQAEARPGGEQQRLEPSRLAELTQRRLLQAYAPAAVLVNERHQILYTSGSVDDFLKRPSGVPSNDLLASLREGLFGKLRPALHRAMKAGERVEVSGAQVRRNGAYHRAQVHILPVKPAEGTERLWLLAFVPEPPAPAGAPPAAPSAGDEASLVHDLEQELKTTKEELQSTREEAESSNEELKAANEEVMSANEELQSTNEELESSKEELQSLNEELATVNNQLQDKVAELEATNDDLSNLLTSTDIATLFLDENLCIKRYTPAMARLVNLIETDVGRPVSDIVHRFSDSDLVEDTKTVLGKLMPRERTVRTEEGRWYQRRILPYRTQDNRISGTVTTFIDVTERQQAEAALRHAKAQADEANRTKSAFLAAASHDLRQPLQTLELLNAALHQQVQAEDAREIIDRQQQSLQVISGLLNALLDISRFESGTVVPKIATVPVAAMFERLAREIEPQAKAKGLRFQVMPCRLAVRSDPGLLERIVQNYLVNAIKYTPQGKVLLGCRRRGAELAIQVWDTGPGIPEADLRSIFRAFHQLDNPARTHSKGLGLGLAIVERLAETLDHHLEVRSTPGKGSMFGVRVPLAKQGKPRQPPALAASEHPDLAGVCIVVIEDEPGPRESLELYLRALGARVLAAVTGDEALARIKAQACEPDVIIADYRLGLGESGIDVIRRLREALGGDAPAILLTGDTSPAGRSQCQALRCEVLYKPVNGQDLAAHIRRLLAKTAGAG
jgi:two-component system CheB/CheR fusion protein